MKRTYKSLEDLSERCTRNDLKVCIFSVLAYGNRDNWKFLSCSEDGDICRADFVSRNEVAGSVSRLSYEFNEMSQFGHITVEALAPTAAKA